LSLPTIHVGTYRHESSLFGDPCHPTTEADLMRKLIESTLASLDGVIGEPMAWADDYFDADAQEAARQQLLASDAMLMGRRTYEMFAAFANGTSDYAHAMNSIRKYVFSSTLDRADWSNSTLIRDEPVTAVRDLKEMDGRDLIMYGHGPLGQTLLDHQLLDEIRLFVHPVFVGRGTLLFRQGDTTSMTLVEAQTLSTGVVLLSYRAPTNGSARSRGDGERPGT
jgi:dihydrofolate reductase